MDADDSHGNATAAAVAARMAETDRVFGRLGMRVESVAVGRCALSLTVRDDMLNGHDICHGGVIFTLADTAFAIACNSRNAVTLAQAAEVSFIAAGEPGEVLTATAEARTSGGRTGIYDVTVSGREGRLIALFRGHSYRIRGKVVENLDTLD
ncbi:MAG: phenylacetic acid degradation protein PaaD [Rhodospirillaceae bacterium]|nr:phenylacetic acid degradation protein PaaD [Rhodospirillaceae bacterium]